MRSFLLATSFVLAGCGGGGDAGPDAMPLTGEELVAARCDDCHGLDWVSRNHTDAAGWDTIVTRMVGYGLHITDDEQARMVEYLAATYPP